MYAAEWKEWVEGLGAGRLDSALARYYGEEGVDRWRERYLEALGAFAAEFGEQGPVVVARCPGQMNIMGMHIDYGGMPSIRLAVRGADTLTVARRRGDRQVRMRSLLGAPGEARRFAPLDFDLGALLPGENVGTRQALMDYAGKVCSRREKESGSSQAKDWGVLPQGALVFLESYFRGRVEIGGLDALVWSNVSPSGGMSSSSALVISTAFAALGAHGLRPHVDLPLVDLVDGVGTSEWIRGTRGGTADHGGMVMGRAGRLVSVGVFPARPCGEAELPGDYAAVILDSGVPRVYDEAGKEETVIAYPLGTFVVRDVLLPQWRGEKDFAGLRADFRQRIAFIRDITEENLGLSLPGLYRLLAGLPQKTSLRQLEAWAREAGAGQAWEEMHRREVGAKFQRIGPDYPIRLRRRFAFGLAEQDRVRYLLEYVNAGRMDTALELVRISHEGDLDREVEDAELAALEQGARRGQERARLCFLPGGYGRMTEAYDRVVRLVNEFLLREGGKAAGSVQRLGAGWGGNVGGLVHRDFALGEKAPAFARLLRREVGMDYDPAAHVAIPGEGACLLEVGS